MGTDRGSAAVSEISGRGSGIIRGTVALVVGFCVAASATPGTAQTNLGGQRVGTSAAAFLKIGAGARVAAMGGAFACIVDDATATQWNPAGLVRVKEDQASFSLVDWPADVTYSHMCLAVPVATLDGTVGIQFGTLGTEMDETTEYYPDGTGRSFTFRDWVAGISFAKRFTDKFSGGLTIKYFRESLGTEIGGPTMSSWLLDAGTWYDVGYGSLRLGVALLNFGPELRPDGHYQSSRASGADGPIEYESFAPPTTFKAGIAVDPIQRPGWRLTTILEMNHPADNVETLILGSELWIGQTLALRAGYDTNADELGFSAGVGVMASLGSAHGTLDYAYTEGEYLGRIDRISIGVRF
jgi:hypothetical protein